MMSFCVSKLMSCMGCLAISHVASISIHHMSGGASVITAMRSSAWYASAARFATAVVSVAN